MVPSPKKTRTSPVKKVSARRSRTASSSSFSSILSDSEISSVNKSWANVTEDDEDMRSELIKSASKSDSRRKGAYPKKANTRPKFVRSLELSEAIMSNGRRSERIRERDKVSSDSNRFGHKETVVKTVMESRKRHLSSASTCTFTGDDEGCSPIKRTTEKGYAISSGRPARKTQREEAPVAKTPSRNRFAHGNEVCTTGQEKIRLTQSTLLSVVIAPKKLKMFVIYIYTYK
uniref:Uncharacterized protein n=1 Tax=Heterorhabditis bacteriophora TaxID=37862 RepID=A0A1I7XBD3_HETBA